jgi:acyl-ACP thioesterase
MIAAPRSGRIFHLETLVGLADVTPSGRARLDAIARWLQDAAWADLVDSGIEDEGIWIVRRMALRIERAPSFQASLDVATFCSGVGRLWAERRTTIRGEDALVEAEALWVHLDASGARPRPLPDGFDAVWGEAANGRRVKARLRHPAEPPLRATTRPWAFRASDLDLAGHVNNAVYWAVLEEELGELPGGWSAEIEHRTAADAGPATIAADGDLRWILDESGAVVASLQLPAG